MSNPRWTEADLVDLEVVLQAEEPLPEPALEERDRGWYLEHGRASDTGRNADRRLLHRWLGFRRQEHFPAGSPGSRFAGTLAGARWLLVGAGLVLGAGYAAGVLAYTGERAINLLAVLALLVALPLVLSLLSIALLLLPARDDGGGASGWMIRRIVGRALRGLSAGAGPEDWPRLARRSRRYRRVMRWLGFALAQRFALAFVMASWLTVLVRGWIADLAFAWQTSAELSAAAVHRLTTWMAVPWAWIEPPPTIEQVAGSRVALKEGLAGLENADLTVWWSYLVWAMLAYAVLPRLVLAAAAGLGRRHSLRTVAFRDPDSRRILRRLRTPRLDVAADEARTRAEGAGGLAGAAGGALGPCVVLVPREVARHRGEPDWSRLVGAHCRGNAEVREVTLQLDDDRALVEDLARLPAEVAALVVQEGWRPCIEEFRGYLRGLRTIIGRDRLLVVGLLGRVVPGDPPRLAPSDMLEWRRRLAELDDPFLEVAALEASSPEAHHG